MKDDKKEKKAKATKTEQTSTLEARKAFIKCWLHANPDVSKESASVLYDHLEARFPEVSRGGHRGLVGRMSPWENLEHECPHCGKLAVGLVEIDDKFGLRKYRGKLYFQSWCRPCRPLKKKGPKVDRINPLVKNVHVK